MKAQTKKSKMIAFFKANPNAKPKDAAAKFKVAMPTIYAIRKQALAGGDWKTAAVMTSNKSVAIDEVAVLDQNDANLVYQASRGVTKPTPSNMVVTTTSTWVCNRGRRWRLGCLRRHSLVSCVVMPSSILPVLTRRAAWRT